MPRPNSYAVFCLKKKIDPALEPRLNQIIAPLKSIVAYDKFQIAFTAFFNDPPAADIYTLSLHDALPIFLQTPKATSSTLYFDSLTVNAGNGGFLHCIQI